jgi:hypothetical protein
MSVEESDNEWINLKHLRFGVHRNPRQPYVSREEFYDPLRCTSAGNKTHCAYVTATYKSSGTSAGPSKLHPGTIQQFFGTRRTPAHAVEFCEKVTWHDPTKIPAHLLTAAEREERGLPPREAGEQRGAPVSGNAQASGGVIRRLPATPLLEEVEERLRLMGLGSLVQVRMASDEAIADLLREAGFSPTQRMTVLWELRKRYPLPHD